MRGVDTMVTICNRKHVRFFFKSKLQTFDISFLLFPGMNGRTRQGKLFAIISPSPRTNSDDDFKWRCGGMEGGSILSGLSMSML